MLRIIFLYIRRVMMRRCMKMRPSQYVIIVVHRIQCVLYFTKRWIKASLYFLSALSSFLCVCRLWMKLGGGSKCPHNRLASSLLTTVLHPSSDDLRATLMESVECVVSCQPQCWFALVNSVLCACSTPRNTHPNTKKTKMNQLQFHLNTIIWNSFTIIYLVER